MEGLGNAQLLLSEKGFYAMSAVAVQKNTCALALFKSTHGQPGA